MALHVGFSVLVLQAFRRGDLDWLWLAIAVHAAVDLTVAAAPLLLGRGLATTLVLEGLIAIYGAVAICAVWRLRESVGRPVPRHQPQPTT